MPNDEFPPEWVEAVARAHHDFARDCLRERGLLAPIQDVPFEGQLAEAQEMCLGAAVVGLHTLRRLLDAGGWQVVPKVADDRMVKAVRVTERAGEVIRMDGRLMEDSVRVIHSAMLSAAPSPWRGSDE